MQQQQQCSGWIVLFLRWYRQFFSHEGSLASLSVPQLTCGALDEESKSQRRPAAMLRVLSLCSRCSLGTSGVSTLFWKDYVSGHTGIDPTRRAESKRPTLFFAAGKARPWRNMSSKRKAPGGEGEGRNGGAGGRRKVRFQKKEESEGRTQKKKFDSSSFSGSVTHCHDVPL